MSGDFPELESFSEADFARRKILAICERTLIASGVAGSFPTPLGELAGLAGIDEVLNIADLPDELSNPRPAGLKRLLGAFHFRSRTAFIDKQQRVGRARWTEAHETSHSLIPWHDLELYLDGEEQLFRGTVEQREIEANVGAAHLLFQGHRFIERAMNYQHSINTPLFLADEVGASIHATTRYYAEHHPKAVGLAVAGIRRRPDGYIPIFHSVESPAFRRLNGRFIGILPAGGIPVRSGLGFDDLAEAASEALAGSTVVETEIPVTDMAGSRRVNRVEVFSNQYNLFLLSTPQAIIRLGTRVRVAR